MTIGVIGAMQMEVDDLKAQMTDTQTEVYSGVEFVEGKIGDQYVVAAKCGIGKVFAAICAEAMILKYDVDMIVNIGVAGTLTKDLNVLDVAVATKRAAARYGYIANRRPEGTSFRHQYDSASGRYKNGGAHVLMLS